jgi:hypothetical protein
MPIDVKHLSSQISRCHHEVKVIMHSCITAGCIHVEDYWLLAALTTTPKFLSCRRNLVFREAVQQLFDLILRTLFEYTLKVVTCPLQHVLNLVGEVLKSALLTSE